MIRALVMMCGACAAFAVTCGGQTVLSVEATQSARLRVGARVHGRLVYPASEGMDVVIPAGALVEGRIVSLTPDHAMRVRSRFNLDFTPFRTPVVRFDEAVLPDGRTISLGAAPVGDGIVRVRVAASDRGKGDVVVRQWRAALGTVRDAAAFFLAPGRGERMRDLALHQLPWHPQWIARGTSWNVATGVLPGDHVGAGAVPTATGIEATLDEALNSANAHAGDAVYATVQEPVRVLGRAVPQGAKLEGKVTEATASRSLEHDGSLRFAFSRVVMPDGSEIGLDGLVSAADVSQSAKLAVDREGAVRPETRDKVIVPVLLIVLAAAPLDPDPGDNDEWVKNAGASNSLGVMGFVAGLSANIVNVSAGFGFYGAALSTADRWLGHGRDVNFAKNARISVRVEQPR